jgi:WS/DGAT/MGAT family acyltransferase
VRQLSPIDSAFVLLEKPRTPFHVTMVNLYDRSTCPGDPPTFDDMVEAVRVSLPVAPTFRRKIVRVPLDLDYPYWVEDEDFDLEFHMRHVALPSPGHWEQFRAQVARLVSRPLDLTRPPWEMTVIDGLDSIEGIAPGGFATVLKIHHSAIDGIAGVELLSALHQQSPHEKPKALPDRWQPEKVPSNLELMQKAGWHSITRPVAIAQLLLQNASALAGAAFEELRSDDDDDDEIVVPKTRLNVAVSAHRIFDDARCTLEDLKRVRRRVEGATINDVCLTIIAEALRRYLDAKGELPEQSLITVVPISTRTPEQAKEGGNQISVTRVSMHTDIADPLARLAAIAKETRKKKAVQDGVVMPVLLDVVQNLPGAIVGAAMRALPLAGSLLFSNTMVTNVPGPVEPLYFLGAKAVMNTGCPPLMDGAGLLHSVCSYNGNFLLSFTACRDLMPDADFYRDCLRTAVKEVIEAAGGEGTSAHPRAHGARAAAARSRGRPCTS